MANAIKIPFICIYENYLDNFSLYSSEEVGNMVLALLTYLRTGEEPNFQGNERFLWPWLRQQLDRDREAYAKRCDANRKNGKLGGRPRKEAIADDCEFQEENSEKDDEETVEETDGFSEEPKKPKNKDKNKNKNKNKNMNMNMNKNKNKNSDNEKDTESEKENDNGEHAGAGAGGLLPASSAPVSYTELQDYIIKLGYPIDPVEFWNHHTGNHWTDNGIPIVDWKHAVSQWYRSRILSPLFRSAAK